MPITVTAPALDRITQLLKDNKASGIRLRLRTKGCSGLSYVMEYSNAPLDGDESIILSPETTLFIQGQALLFLVGTEMDYEQTPTHAGFIFRNPHEKGRCGCGASFHV